ncbi:MAG TPA: HAMP domain-containing sensor histidine kinase [Segeticoccus sp.]|uniref:sensor histidine kinase n=1 Tax=Segeticoccus sp. TaxID=2706531 RepID=UPI002D7E498C|nr:HAMP domain-containing sensor histidine kinase [Segeticoccus sp.]HET8599091.1 HAMP domain-containing sensor histidine kinase [Segeticoccus sp.]
MWSVLTGRARALPGQLSQRWSRWSLRTRLLIAVTTLVALVCVVIGGITEAALQHSLVHQLDTQLISAGGRSANVAGSEHHSRGPLPDGNLRTDTHRGARFLLAPGQASGTLGARIVAGQVTAAAVLDDEGVVRPLNGNQASALSGLAADGRPQTVSIPGHGAYRVVAATMPDGDRVVTGLPMSTVNATLWETALVELVLTGAALVLTTAAGALIVRRTLRPLDRVAATATRVSTLPLERGEVALLERVPEVDTDPGTEVGQVGTALNRLLDHVATALTARQASESRVRQFVADASHELRTPLAAIRGYAELTRRSRAQSPPDVAHALDRVESEAIRMTTLVEDLLLLARLDAGRPLQQEPVDLTQLLVNAVGDAAVAGPDHDWRLAVPDEPLVVRGDAARLHQVAANLLANARSHTPAGTEVTASLRHSPGGSEVTLTVQDDGPGIPQWLLPEVFERFARGEASRSRTHGSTGLGLAIVAATVGAHGGRVAVESHPGGTVFTVTLPAWAGAPSGQNAPSPRGVPSPVGPS